LKDKGIVNLDDTVRWIITSVLALIGLGTLGWFVSSGPSWEIRRMMNEYKYSASPRMEDYVRKFVWKGPSNNPQEEWVRLEGQTRDEGVS
jgi:hypothetical protein